MNLSKFNLIIGVSTLMISSASYADVIPYGIQTNVSDAQIVDWGWSECHRSTSNAGVAESTVTNNCAGGYLARGIWDESRGEYGVIGVGLYDVVTDQTYTDFHGDGTGTVQNWSNGLNWYRTVISGSWGFTTSGQTALNTADVNLQNGLNSYDTVGTIETDLAAGLTFHTNGGYIQAGYAYNPDGYTFTRLTDEDQRVFWAVNEVPTPAAVWLFGSGLIGLIGIARRKKRND